MIVVTGGAGFIGSNLVKGLNAQGVTQILVVDDLSDGTKFKNLVDCQILDYMDKNEFLEKIRFGHYFSHDIEAIFHEGACSDTTEWDGRFMMDNNYEYSKHLLHYCLNNKIQFLYASSAAVYGTTKVFKEHPDYEGPLNVYGYSKYLFDQYVRQLTDINSQVVGFRYFNVYGPNEQHKGTMASMAYHFNNQVREHGTLRLFEGTDGYANGGQLRDFIHVDDVVAVNLWFLKHKKSGIFNLGTGRAQSFNDVANAVIDWHQKGQIEYIPFPEHLKGRYQSYTQADMDHLRKAGYPHAFMTVEEGVTKYLNTINQKQLIQENVGEPA